MVARTLLLIALAVLTPVPALASAERAKAPPASPGAAAPVAVSAAWVREAPPGAHALGGYLTITNQGTKPLTLSGVSSPWFDAVEMHTVYEEGGRMQMKQVMGLPLAPGGTLVFKPRDQHLMLMRPKRAVKAGDKVPVVLDFGPAGICRLEVEVKRPVAR